MNAERIERRILAALRFTDSVTGKPVTFPLEVHGARVVRNSRGHYVILSPLPDDARLKPYLAAFRSLPTNPAAGSIPLPLTVEDFSGNYVVRSVTLHVPLQSTDQDAPNYLFKPVVVKMYPTPAYPVGPNWAECRIAIRKQGSALPIYGALVQVFKQADNALLGAGLSDRRGEALVAIAGLPLLAPNSGAGGPLLTGDVQVKVRVSYDAASAEPPDPDVLADAAGLPNQELNDSITPQRLSKFSFEMA